MCALEVEKISYGVIKEYKYLHSVNEKGKDM